MHSELRQLREGQAQAQSERGHEQLHLKQQEGDKFGRSFPLRKTCFDLLGAGGGTRDNTLTPCAISTSTRQSAHGALRSRQRERDTRGKGGSELTRADEEE